MLFFLFFVFLISGDLPVKPVDELLNLAVEKVIYEPLMALLVDSSACHYLVTLPVCVAVVHAH